ncbi:MAG: serine hydrolase domain-containing protein [Pseudomonadota bacterium]
MVRYNIFSETRARRPDFFAVWVAVLMAFPLAHASPPSPANADPDPAEAFVRKDVEPFRDDLAPQIRSVQKEYRVPGISLVVVNDREILWAEGFGYADKSRRRAATPATVYRAGSLAKPFTAIAVMQLADAGKIDLDRPLERYVPELAIRSRFATSEPFTVRNALSHHSGLPTDLNKGMWTNADFGTVVTNLADEYMAFPPKVVFSYSNVGYTLLGHAVQHVGRKAYADYMDEAVFRPLDMAHSGFVIRPAIEEKLSKGYNNGKAMDLLPIRDLPAIGLYTSASDLGKFMRAILATHNKGGGTVLSGKAFKQMFSPQNNDVELDLNIIMGLGWFLEDGRIAGASRVARHGGTTLAFNSEMILLPEQGLGVAVLANSHGSQHIVSQLAEAILARMLKGGHAPFSGRSLKTAVTAAKELPQIGDMSGSYATDMGLIAIKPEKEELCACLVDQKYDVIPYPDGWFGITKGAIPSLPSSLKPLGNMRFQTQLIDGREVVVAKNGDKKIVLGEKVAQKPIPQAWVERAGHYELMNPDDGFPLTEPQVRIRDGQLCMSYKMPLLSDKRIQVPLQPISDTEAIILGLGRMRGETLRAVTVDGEERLRYSGFVGRKR